MEQKQLDFNAPLLSVRRFSAKSTTSLPYEEEKSKKVEEKVVQEKRHVLPFYKSELKSGPVRNPGVVPFSWEQIPGRPKDEGRALLRPPERLLVGAPKIPPGRRIGVEQQNLDKEFDKRDVHTHLNENVRRNAAEKALDSNGNVSKFGDLEEGVKEEGSSGSGGSDDETFTDAMDTLSRTESFFLNCSVTGLSGLDGGNVLKPSGTFSTDPLTRDFMMNRFLPAAKAMASEAPKHTQRKKPAATHVQPRELRMVVHSEKKTPVLKYKPNYVEPQHVEDTEEEEESEDDDDYDHSRDLSAKACGLLPRFCLKNSFCLLNPVPGMKVRSESPIRSVRKTTSRIKSDNSEFYSATDNENNWEAVYKHKLLSGLGSLNDESKRTSESNQLTWSDSQTPDGSSFRHSVGGGISPYRNEASQSPFHEGTGFLGIPKNVKHVKANSLDRLNNTHHSSPESLPRYHNKRQSGTLNHLAEKTLYVDSEHLLETPPMSTLSSSDARELVECSDKGLGTPTASLGMEETPKDVSCFQDNNSPISNEKATIPLKTAEVIDTRLKCSPDGSNHIECSSKKTCCLHQDSKPLDSRQQINGLLEFSQTQELIPYDHTDSDLTSFQAPLAPPLPKSPSESWLWRTLPSIPTKNAARFVPRRQGLTPHSTDSKWEIVVKTSNV
ncbi:hypothetical protein Syun_008874 [Stephania yunnanensis]|uniref:Uncharacterized protein n=1 Tax=Stephania yunnanensis TaxID=152371 RepID=A0AAP0PQD7_9MAGN